MQFEKFKAAREAHVRTRGFLSGKHATHDAPATDAAMPICTCSPPRPSSASSKNDALVETVFERTRAAHRSRIGIIEMIRSLAGPIKIVLMERTARSATEPGVFIT